MTNSVRVSHLLVCLGLLGYYTIAVYAILFPSFQAVIGRQFNTPNSTQPSPRTDDTTCIVSNQSSWPDRLDPFINGDDEAVDDLPLCLPRLQPVQLVVLLMVHIGYHRIEFGEAGCWYRWESSRSEGKSYSNLVKAWTHLWFRRIVYFLIAKSLCSQKSHLIMKRPYGIRPDFGNDGLGFGPAHGRWNRRLLSHYNTMVVWRRVRVEHIGALEIDFRFHFWNIGEPIAALVTLVPVDGTSGIFQVPHPRLITFFGTFCLWVWRRFGGEGISRSHKEPGW